jgi:acyl-CoA synthetase (AMP-forming)/AMP-acid ligase II
VIGVPDSYWGERVVACVIPESNSLTVRDIDEHCRGAALAGFKRPRQYVFVDYLPRNASNKVLRPELRDMVTRDNAARLCA